jgi:hypothetical protein
LVNAILLTLRLCYSKGLKPAGTSPPPNNPPPELGFSFSSSFSSSYISLSVSSEKGFSFFALFGYFIK